MVTWTKPRPIAISHVVRVIRDTPTAGWMDQRTVYRVACTRLEQTKTKKRNKSETKTRKKKKKTKKERKEK